MLPNQSPEQATNQLSNERRWRLRPVAATLGVVALALVVLGVARGGFFSPPPLPHFTVLYVTRDADVGQDYPYFEVTVRDSAAITRLYAAALQLPVIPTPTPGGPGFICANIPFLVYHLTFVSGRVVVARMDLGTVGYKCGPTVIVEDPYQLRPDDGTFSALAAKTLGLSSLFAREP